MSYYIATDPHEVGFTGPSIADAFADAIGCDYLDIDVYDRSAILKPADLARLLDSGEAAEFRRASFAGRVTLQAWYDGPDDERWRLSADFLPGEEPS